MNCKDFLLKNLFHMFGELRAEFNSLDKQTEILNEIAMNASVTAAQTGKNIKIFTELSNHISSSAKKMKNFILINREQLNSILNNTLKVLTSSTLEQKYSFSIDFIKNKQNFIFLKRKIDSIENRWSFDIQQIKFHLYPAISTLKSILQLQYKLFGTYNCLIIESLQLEGNQKTAILNLSKSLLASFESSIYCVNNLFLIIKKIQRIIKKLLLKEKHAQNCSL